ncbi:MAG: hypothetical protein ACUVQ1_05230 [Candidatus Kapaibacteriales bacterium]
MKYFSCFSGFLALLLLISCQEKIDSVIKKNLEIRGGNYASKLKSFEIKMQLSVAEIQIPMDILLERPMKMRTDMFINNQAVTTIFNGNRGWANVNGIITELKDQELEDLKRNYHSQIRYLTSDLYDIESQGGKITSMSKSSFKGKKAYKIQIDFKDGQRSYVFLDANSYLNLGTRMEKIIDGNLFHTETVYSDYRRINNFLVPFKMEIFSENTNVLTLRIDSLILDKSFPESTFSFEKR